ncbi:MAG TPA: SDR family oxidoreductase [Alphaproteobacteria bacterium]
MPTLLVTGAGRGIGFEMARQFAADGWRVIATIRNPEQHEELKALGRQVETHLLDVTDRGRIERLARSLKGQPIDILLCNAAIYGPKGADQEFGQVDWITWTRAMQTNVMGPLGLAESFVDHVAASERKLMVMMTSQMGSTAQAGGGAYIYRSSKAALNNVVRNLAVDLAGRGITVVAVVPGWVRTDMGGPGAPLTPEASVRQLRTLFDRIRPKQSGKFLNYDGREIPW